MGNGMVRRYKGGKRPEKYFAEDVWPKYKEMFGKLGFRYDFGFQLFQMFADIDVDESATVDLDECHDYLGGRRTRLTERFFDIKDSTNAEEGLPFLAFSIAVWNFATMTTEMIARYIWEIFDIDNSCELEQPDVEAMFRMIYALEMVEDKIISKYKFDPGTGMISKLAFIQTAKREKKLLNPILNFQKRCRKKIGGLDMWDKLVTYRKRFYSVYDQQSPTLEEALQQIIASRPQKKVELADVKLQQEKIKLEKAMREARAEQAALEREAELERKRLELIAEDRSMKMAWNALDSQYEVFSNKRYLLDETFERSQCREELFNLLEAAIRETEEYWDNKNSKERELMVGTPEDHQARYDDFLDTDEGQHERKRELVLAICRLLLERFPPSHRMSGKETERLGHISDVQSQIQRMNDIFAKQLKSHEHAQELYATMKEEHKGLDVEEDKELTIEVHVQFKLAIDKCFAGVKKYLNRSDLPNIESTVDHELMTEVMRRASQELEWSIARGIEERRRAHISKEWKIISIFGGRQTRWELVFDKENMRNVYVNTDTLQLMHEKSAICERCDAVFAQSELRCADCDAARSAKNLRLYRPLGYKDITQE